MPSFSYKALDASGASRTGTLEAEDRRAAARLLAAQGLRVMTLQSGATEPAGRSAPEPGAYASSGSAASGMPRSLQKKRLLGPHSVGWDFIDSFYQLHSNGLPMGDAVKLLTVRVSNPALQFLCQSLWRDMSEGATMAGAMSRFPAVFDPATIYLIEAGENTGNLLPVLKKVLDSYTMREDLRSRILSSITYPIGVCSLAAAVLGLFVFFLMPRLEHVMRNLKGDFSWSVKLMMGFSDFLVKGGPFLFIAGLLVVLGISQWRKTAEGRKKTDTWLLKIPLLGPVVLHTEIVKMTELLATLMSSGINASEALRLTERPVANMVLRERLSAGRLMINDGAAFASAFKRHHILPLDDLDILAVGENTGSMAETFQNISKRHVKGLDKSIQRMLRVITVTVLGLTVSLVFVCMISILMTIFNVSQNL